MADATPGLRPRPISPQVQLNGGIWRWHLTMAASILHRVTGVGLYIGALVMLVWAVALASGSDAYAVFTGLAGSILGKAGFFILTLCVFYHLANGVRHLVWDAGYGFKPTTATQSAVVVMVFAVVATTALWALLAATGAI